MSSRPPTARRPMKMPEASSPGPGEHRTMDIQLTLTFACCRCQHSITATLACKGADPGDERVAAVNVPCPTCGQECQLLFDPLAGTVHGVRPYQPAQPIPEPSRN